MPLSQGDRLDRVAADAFGDPSSRGGFCDANGALDPDELVSEIGRRLVIPQSVG